MYPSLFTYRKHLYIALALVPILVGALGFYTLLKSPYTGINFESKEGKWYVASVNPGSPAAAHQEMVGMEVVAIEDFRLGAFDLVDAYVYIPDENSYNHFWEAQRYFDEHVKIGVPLSVTLDSSNILRQARHERQEDALYDMFGSIQSDKSPVRPELVEGQSTILITPSPFSLSQALFNVFAQTVSALAALFVGLVVALKRPDDKKAGLFSLFSLFGSLIVLCFNLPAARDIAYNNLVYHINGYMAKEHLRETSGKLPRPGRL